jgi:hypothetical protein
MIIGGKPARPAGAQGAEERKRRGSASPCLPGACAGPTQPRQRNDEAATVATKLAATCAS